MFVFSGERFADPACRNCKTEPRRPQAGCGDRGSGRDKACVEAGRPLPPVWRARTMKTVPTRLSNFVACCLAALALMLGVAERADAQVVGACCLPGGGCYYGTPCDCAA